jgi:hypothetical protein
MKRRATGLLVGATVLFVLSLALERQFPWLAFVRATAEAAMVGGLADWFASRRFSATRSASRSAHGDHPRAARIASAEASADSFRTTSSRVKVIAARLHGLHIAERIAKWISDPSNSNRIAHHVATGPRRHGRRAARRGCAGDDRPRGGHARAQDAGRAGAWQRPVAADRGQRHQELLDEALRLVPMASRATRSSFASAFARRAVVGAGGGGRQIHDKVVVAIENTLRRLRRTGAPVARAVRHCAAAFIEQLRRRRS